MRAILRKFSAHSLSVKIVTIFFVLLCVSLLSTFLLYRGDYERIRHQEFDGIARQNAEIIAASIDSMIETVSYTSKLLLSNETLQSMLIGQENFASPSIMRTLTMLLSSTANLQPHVAAIYLFDTHGQKIGVDNYSPQRFAFDRVEEASWYEAVFQQHGYYQMLLNAGQAQPMYGSENVISLVRSVYNLNMQSELLGTLMVNMRESFLTNCFSAAEATNGMRVTVVDAQGSPLLSGDSDFFNDLSADRRDALIDATGTVGLFVQNGQSVFYCAAPTRNADWRVVTAIPYGAGTEEAGGARYMLWVALLVLLLFVILSTLIIIRMVTRPLHLLSAAMRIPDGAHPTHVQMHTADDEIGKLKHTYNELVDRIEELIARIEAESRRKRKAELQALQAQVNPHFLYNTIDTARALALSGDNAALNHLLRSLGEFYRNSIHTGKEIITVGEEIDTVRSYMAIQQIRYTAIQTRFEVDDAVRQLRIPKLVLQPLVENALYHGLRPAGNKGTITLRVWQDERRAYLSVSDDGVGISGEAVDRAFRMELAAEENGFGLHGTIDRLRLFYGDRQSVSIQNGARGTCITIAIDRERGPMA